ncbi:hypothetical protein CDD82_5145 [Ophiocordyceps australis]|uniref:PH domain-containing protein n=1 Tax=Ophiocordyceps australis TaxID=1399860 RepID=A0A2C5ZL29_9HYPO|nr:hypothetical protein CDD82_5145 [Ophiocordyceps australis]
MARCGVASWASVMNRGLPVGLNEAALDSPTFRASAIHFSEQMDALERWLNGYMSSTSKLVHDMMGLEETVNTYLSKTIPWAADGIIENDYTFLALKRVADGQRECWMQTLSSIKKVDNVVIEPIRAFLGGDMRTFKECRRSLEQTQRVYDTALGRFVGQSKTKEPSALREDAFAVYENRKAYIQAAMEFCVLAPQLRFAMDQLLVKLCGGMWMDMLRSRDASVNATRWAWEMDRVRGWAREMEVSEGSLKRQLEAARREISETVIQDSKPSRELDDYSTCTTAFPGSHGPINMQTKGQEATISEKQGWLFLRVISGKPVRYSWVRRWYYCRDGVFGWLMAGPQGVVQGDEIGVLLCNARPAGAEERRFCFEVKTKNQTMMLQAETQRELMQWVEVFEVTKKKAFEASMSQETGPVAGTMDPAFAISPPSAPEFSARAADGQMNAGEEANAGFERSAALAVAGADVRQSLDVNSGVGRRSFTALGRDLALREEGESGRDHAARIMQKLDLHRKSVSTAAMEPSLGAPASAGGGIASLISASHNLLPVHPSNLGPATPRQTGALLPSLDSSAGSLAPMTLARPPTMTSLSRMAVVVTGERSSGANDWKLPTGIIANYWGSKVWAAAQLREPKDDDDDDDDDDDNAVGLVVAEDSRASSRMPVNYPAELQSQHAQFRLLFPGAPAGEKLVLVFRAAWSRSVDGAAASEAVDSDGRIYVTSDNMYFYGQQMGLVVAFGLHLDLITEVSTSSGKDCDYIYLHLGRGGNEVQDGLIAVRVFLDNVDLLHTRLNLLVDNLQAEEPMDSHDLILALVNVEREGYDKASPSGESWEEVSSNTPVDDGTFSGKPASRPRQGQGPRHPGQHSRHRHHGDAQHEHRWQAAGYGSHRHHRGPPKLHLPAQPVVYEPDDMVEMAAERHFEISAKACFHVLFGDKSFVFPKLYFERRAQQIAQGPWLLVDQGKMRRDFSFSVRNVDMLGRARWANINDFQRIDVYSDHVTYVVTHSKTAWHLPHSGSFKLVTKIVISYLAKSKSKLAIYIGIDWSKAPALSKKLVERQALHDAANDAEELAELATDQVRKLGPRSRTNRAIQVYGHVGQQTQVVVFSPATSESSKRQTVKPRTLTALLLETARSFAESAVSSLIMWAFAGLRKLFAIVSAQRLLLTLLVLSLVTNVLLTSAESSAWWRERRAVRFMQKVGVGPNTMMSKAVYISDLDEAVRGGEGAFSFARDGGSQDGNNSSACFGTFKTLLDASDMDAPWQEAGAKLTWPRSRATARRLRRTRQRLGSYRHDLVVAMRVVNSVERQVVQSEWENWLVNEKSLCDGLDVVYGGGKAREAQLFASKRLRPEEHRAIDEWRQSHCGSCRKDLEAVMRQRMTVRAPE